MPAVDTPSTAQLIGTLFGELLNRRDPELLRPHMADELVETFPVVGRLEGREAVLAYFREMFAALPDFHIEAERLAVAGETAFVQWHVNGTFSGGPLNRHGPPGP